MLVYTQAHTHINTQVIGYALYLVVGFNFIMGSTVRMKQVGVAAGVMCF